MLLTMKNSESEMAPKNPFQIGHEIVFCSEVREPEQANFQRQLLVTTYSKAVKILSCSWV